MNSIQLVISNEVHEVQVKEHNGQRVITLRDMEQLHCRPEGTAGRNFRQNSKHLIEGEDYFRRNSSEALNDYGLKAPNGLILLTESGYLMLVKSFTDDLAWQVQRQLVKSYFKVKKAYQEQQIPTSTEDIMIYALQSQKEMKAEIARLQVREKEQANEIHRLKLVVDNEVWLTDNQKAQIQEAVDRRCGELVKDGYGNAHFQGIYKTLKNHFEVPSYHKIKRGDFEKAINIVKGWYPKKQENSDAN